VLGFESRLDAPAAVALTMDWYRRQGAGEDALSLCLEQIEGYEGAA
jgi:CDP-glucose 4,6-dehydratase